MASYSLDEVRAMSEAEAAGQPVQPNQPASYSLDDVKAMQEQEAMDFMLRRETSDLASNLRRGAKDVIDTGAELLAKGWDKLAGSNEYERVRAMNQAGTEEWDHQNRDLILPHVQRVAGNLLTAQPAVRAVGAGLTATSIPFLRSIGNAVTSAGMTTGARITPVADMTARVVGGGVNGYMTAGLADPDSADMGGAIGAVTPAAAKAVGTAFHAAGNALRGPAVPESVRQSVSQAQQAGYVVPPTQARPTLVNRFLEGTAGKLSTAQQASAKNQGVTNSLVRRELGIADDIPLSTDTLDAIRAEAGKAYGAIANLGRFEAMGAKLPKDVKVQNFTDMLTLRRRSEVDAGELVRAWRQANHDANGYYRAFARDANPETQAKAKAAATAAKQIDEFLESSLEKMGRADMVQALREARVRIAKTYSVEKALNSSTGNVDATKLAKTLDNDKPLSGNLRTIAEVSKAFPKATQLQERMGSLPGISPLDVATFASLSGMTGNPNFLGGLFLRPMARNAALSRQVQRGLLAEPSTTGGLLGAAGDDLLSPLLYQTAPLLGVSR